MARAPVSRRGGGSYARTAVRGGGGRGILRLFFSEDDWFLELLLSCCLRPISLAPTTTHSAHHHAADDHTGGGVPLRPGVEERTKAAASAASFQTCYSSLRGVFSVRVLLILLCNTNTTTAAHSYKSYSTH